MFKLRAVWLVNCFGYLLRLEKSKKIYILEGSVHVYSLVSKKENYISKEETGEEKGKQKDVERGGDMSGKGENRGGKQEDVREEEEKANNMSSQAKKCWVSFVITTYYLGGY